MTTRVFSHPWPAVTERLSRIQGEVTKFRVSRFLWAIALKSDSVKNPEDRAKVNLAARQLLTQALGSTPKRFDLAETALWALCKTIDAAPEATATAANQVLAPEVVAEGGHTLLGRLADEVSELAKFAPELTVDLYRAAFAKPDDSKQAVALTPSQIHGMSMTRKQRYGMALHQLGEKFGAFLRIAPKAALTALVEVVEGYVAREHPMPQALRQVEDPVAGTGKLIIEDASSFWDDGLFRGSHPEIAMLDAFTEYVGAMGADPTRNDELQEHLTLIRAQKRPAVIWARLLDLGAKRPDTLGRDLLPLALMPEFQLCFDTSEQATDLVAAIHPLLSSQGRAEIEASILSLPSAAPKERGKYTRGRMSTVVFRLQLELLVDPEAKLLGAKLAKDATPRSPRRPRRQVAFGNQVTEEEYLAERGVPVAQPANRTLRELAAPLVTFANLHLNDSPDLAEVEGLFPVLSQLRQAVIDSGSTGAHVVQVEASWTALVEAARTAAKCEGISAKPDCLVLIRTILLEGSVSQHPAPDVTDRDDADEHLRWGRSPRLDAAAGLLHLCSPPGQVTPEAIEAIVRLAADPVHEVRRQVARHLNRLYDSAPAVMWMLLDQFAKQEPNQSVLRDLIFVIGVCAPGYPTKACELLVEISQRLKPGKPGRDVVEMCADLFTDLAIYHDQPLAKAQLEILISDPLRNSGPCLHALTRLRHLMTFGDVGAFDPMGDRIRKESFGLFSKIVSSTYPTYLAAMKDFYARDGKLSEEELEALRHLRHLAETFGFELYASSGVSGAGHHPTGDPVSPEKMQRFFTEASEIFDLVAQVALPNGTHHLLETLEYFIPEDPKGVLLRLAEAMKAGAKGDYHFENLAMDLLDRIVKRYIADYRHMFWEDEAARRALVSLIDYFVEAGWPAAHALVYRMDDIYR